MTPVEAIGMAGLAGLSACLVTLILTPLVRTVAVRAGWTSRPAEDRWGKRVIARLGGVAMFLGFAAAVLVFVPLQAPLLGLMAGAGLVFILGLVDDLRRMPPYAKLIGQLLVGCVIVIGGIRIELVQWPWLSIPLSVFWFVFVMNAFNLLDNMDGLAAGVGAIAAAFCAWHAALAGQWVVVSLTAILCGTCLGFLLFNFPPAKIYMGDSGSHFLGLSLAALALHGSWHHSTQLLSVLAVPLLVLAVPIFDTCFVTIQRLVNRQHPFVGGTDHISHRLAILGLSTRQTVLVLYGVSVTLGLLSVASVFLKPLPTLVIWLFVLTSLVLIGRYLAQVSVYRVKPQAAPSATGEPGKPVTVIETMLLHKRRLVEILTDFAIVSGAYVCAHLLRFEGALTPDLQHLVIQSLPVILVVKLACFTACGLYRGVWRYLGLSDIITVFKAVTLGSLLSSLALLYLWRFEGYSRSVLIIDWTLTFLAIGGARVVERLLDEWIRGAVAQGVPIVIIGAGDTGARVLRLLKDEKRSTCRVVGFLDDDIRKHGNRIYGVPIVGGRTELSNMIKEFRVREVLVAMSDAPGELLQDIQRCCEPHGVTWRVVTAGVTSAV